MTNETMTIEEAINALIGLKDYYNDENEYSYIGFDDADNKALDMAVRALEVVQFMEEVFLQELPRLDMREATEEERNSLKHYIDSISQSTGVKFNYNGVKIELEPCDDCISRTEAINAFERFIHELGIKDEPYNYGEMALSVQNVPSVKPQRPPGKWKYVTHYGSRYRVCSECGAEKEDDRSMGWNYCFYCGAKMEGDK